MIKTNFILGKNKLNSFELYSMQSLNNVATPVFYANSVLKHTKVKKFNIFPV